MTDRPLTPASLRSLRVTAVCALANGGSNSGSGDSTLLRRKLVENLRPTAPSHIRGGRRGPQAHRVTAAGWCILAEAIRDGKMTALPYGNHRDDLSRYLSA